MYHLAIADDEELILNGLKDYYPWEDLGFEVCLKVNNGQEIINRLSEGLKIDVLLCDIAMPETDGIEVARIISAKYPQVIVVFLSGHADFSYAQNAVRFNVFDYLLKPVKYEDLISTFTKVRLKLDERNGVFQSESTYYANLINKIHALAEENIANISWKYISHELHMSSNYLSYLYKKQTGKNFNEYLNKLKMEIAMKKLIETDMKAYEISEMLGYTNPKNFSRAFSQYFGKSPREVRSE